MVIRDTDPVAVVTQPAHAWLAGQIARVWGNERFPDPPLNEELVYATVQHDIGYLDWELAPTVDRETGRPHTYKTMPCGPHLELWRQGIRWMEPVSRFCALIISLHAAGLYERHFDQQSASASDSEQIQTFIRQQHRYQQQMITSLTSLARYSVLNDPEMVSRISYLVGTWDLMSLHLCEGAPQPLVLDKVPCVHGAETVLLQPLERDPGGWGMAPWPFAVPEVALHFDAKTIHPPYGRDDELRSDLLTTSSQSVTVRLLPGERDIS